MIPAKLGQFVRLQRVMMTLAGFSFGLLGSILANWLSDKWAWLIPIIVALAVISGLVSLILFLKQRSGIEVMIEAPITIRWPDEAKLYARRGFVGFVPLYTPKRGESADGLSPEELANAVKNLDFDLLNLEKSNLQPTIHAIMTHAERLEHCWLISTVNLDPKVPGSLPYARLVAEYLRQKKGAKCDFHYEEKYSVPLEDEALVMRKTYDKVRQVFQEAAQKKISAQEMVADITTGLRSMPFGMILACLGRDQDIEFVGTRYDENGRPTGDLFPIIFGFEPIVRQ